MCRRARPVPRPVTNLKSVLKIFSFRIFFALAKISAIGHYGPAFARIYPFCVKYRWLSALYLYYSTSLSSTNHQYPTKTIGIPRQASNRERGLFIPMYCLLPHGVLFLISSYWLLFRVSQISITEYFSVPDHDILLSDFQPILSIQLFY